MSETAFQTISSSVLQKAWSRMLSYEYLTGTPPSLLTWIPPAPVDLPHRKLQGIERSSGIRVANWL